MDPALAGALLYVATGEAEPAAVPDARTRNTIVMLVSMLSRLGKTNQRLSLLQEVAQITLLVDLRCPPAAFALLSRCVSVNLHVVGREK